jgi:hypothetical protein
MSMVVTSEPCGGCLKLIRGAQLWHVYWPGGEHNFEPEPKTYTFTYDGSRLS